MVPSATPFALMLWTLSLLASPASAATIEGVPFAGSVDLGEERLPLRGTGLLRYMVVFKAYVGALYLPDETPAAAVLEAVPKRLELQYFHPIAAADLADATRKMIVRNADPDTLPALSGRVEQLGAIYRGVRPGDRYALTYRPGAGTELALNGEALGIIPGDDFAAAVFAIWLGRNPIDAGFRDALLGGA
jgi:hypothetical protein